MENNSIDLDDRNTTGTRQHVYLTDIIKGFAAWTGIRALSRHPCDCILIPFPPAAEVILTYPYPHL